MLSLNKTKLVPKLLTNQKYYVIFDYVNKKFTKTMEFLIKNKYEV